MILRSPAVKAPGNQPRRLTQSCPKSSSGAPGCRSLSHTVSRVPSGCGAASHRAVCEPRARQAASCPHASAVLCPPTTTFDNLLERQRPTVPQSAAWVVCDMERHAPPVHAETGTPDAWLRARRPARMMQGEPGCGMVSAGISRGATSRFPACEPSIRRGDVR